MGLDTSHDCWHGPYSTFMRWRRKIAKLAGIPLDLMEGFYYEDNVGGTVFLNELERLGEDSAVVRYALRVRAELPLKWSIFQPDVLHILLHHSDCDGIIESQYCEPLADRLEQLLPLLPAEDGGGHIGWRDKTQAFIDGLRLAARKGEDVDFH